MNNKHVDKITLVWRDNRYVPELGLQYAIFRIITMDMAVDTVNKDNLAQFKQSALKYGLDTEVKHPF